MTPFKIERAAQIKFCDDLHTLKSSVARNLPKNQTYANGPAFDATCLDLMRHLKSSNPRQTVQYGWDAVIQTCNIYGKNSPESAYVLNAFLNLSQWSHRTSISQEFLIGILNEENELVKIQVETSTTFTKIINNSGNYTNKHLLCNWFRE